MNPMETTRGDASHVFEGCKFPTESVLASYRIGFNAKFQHGGVRIVYDCVLNVSHRLVCDFARVFLSTSSRPNLIEFRDGQTVLGNV
jgi:hypothetical protein